MHNIDTKWLLDSISSIKTYSPLLSSTHSTGKGGRVASPVNSEYFSKTPFIFIEITTQSNTSDLYSNHVHIFYR